VVCITQTELHIFETFDLQISCPYHSVLGRYLEVFRGDADISLGHDELLTFAFL